MSILLEVFGEYAAFNRPELKTERMTYDVMTPSAARGILDSIYWHPGMRWHPDKIYVLSPIKHTNIRRNEVKSKISARNVKSAMLGKKSELYIDAQSDIQQRAALVLKDVHYVISAHFDITDKANPSDNPGKFQDIIRRRIEKGQCYNQPYFGCREFPVNFRKWECDYIPTTYPNETKDLGLMLYDMEYSDDGEITPTFFNAVLKNGVLDLNDCEVYR